jgi:nicotinamidase-related amidase
MSIELHDELPLPEHFDAGRLDEVYRVPYQDRFRDAVAWRERHELSPASRDELRIGLLLVDVQNSFCLPEFELFVAGRSGSGAVEDNGRLCRFLYRNLHNITQVHATLDTHSAAQIFHGAFLVDRDGRHPEPMTTISVEQVEGGEYGVDPELAPAATGRGPVWLRQHLEHYCRTLERDGKFSLMVWPYHAMLGGIGHALVAAVEEALFFHSIARCSPVSYEIKGRNPLSENYSALRPEVRQDADGNPIAGANESLIQELLSYDALVVAGQAKSHCVSWTVADLLSEIRERDAALAKRVFLLEDCSSPVVVPGVVDFTEPADDAYRRFAEAGMHVVQSTTPMAQWSVPTPRESRN